MLVAQPLARWAIATTCGRMTCDPWAMTVFACRNCGAVVTVDISEATFLDDPAAHDERTDSVPRVRQGTFALDPEPFGPPFEPLPDNPQVLVSAGPQATILVYPDDVLNLCRHPDPRGSTAAADSMGSTVRTWSAEAAALRSPLSSRTAGSAGTISGCNRTRLRQSRSVYEPSHA